MKQKGIICVVCIGFGLLALPALAETDVKCERIGNTTVCSNGTTYEHKGDKTIRSDGVVYEHIGNTTISSTGRVYEQKGDEVRVLDGKVYKKVGTAIIGSDGTVCQTRNGVVVCERL